MMKESCLVHGSCSFIGSLVSTDIVQHPREGTLGIKMKLLVERWLPIHSCRPVMPVRLGISHRSLHVRDKKCMIPLFFLGAS